LGNRKAVPCDFVTEGIFASRVSEEILKKNIILNPLMKAPHIKPNDAQ
jgi:hypothetical protein